jgi:hypothetical protein
MSSFATTKNRSYLRNGLEEIAKPSGRMPESLGKECLGWMSSYWNKAPQI